MAVYVTPTSRRRACPLQTYDTVAESESTCDLGVFEYVLPLYENFSPFFSAHPSTR